VLASLVDTASITIGEVEMLVNEVVGPAGGGPAVDKGMSGRVDVDADGIDEDDVLG